MPEVCKVFQTFWGGEGGVVWMPLIEIIAEISQYLFRFTVITDCPWYYTRLHIPPTLHSDTFPDKPISNKFNSWKLY